MVHFTSMANLQDFLTRNGIKQLDFAQRLRVRQSTVSRLARNEMTPSLHLAVAIENATDGEIKAADWAQQQNPGNAAS